MAKYANAPLKYVVFAADLSPVSLLGDSQALDEIHAALRDALPVREDLTNALVAGPDSVFRNTSGTRLVDAARHLAVLVTPARIVVDTTRYSTFRDFLSFLETVFDAIAAVAPGRACRRLGLRYIDEIRVPNAQPGNVLQWRDWINVELLPAIALHETSRTREVSGVIEDTDDDGFGVRFAWHTGSGYVVAPNGPLIVPEPSEPGPYFALDTDSYWSAKPGVDIVGLGDPALVDRVRRLHEPVQSFFETSLTDRLRSEVLRPLEAT